MQTYEEIKAKLVENKQKIILGLCFILVFVVGFGAGSFEKGIRRNALKPQNNYTTQTDKKPVNNEGEVQATSSAPSLKPSAATSADCPIKGNISATKKIYHVKGGSFYARVKPEQCFNTEAEALAAGFVKSSR